MDKVTQFAKMIDHSLLHPTMTDEQLKQGCDIARKYNTASVCIKPYAVKQAVKWLKGSDVLVGTVIGFPHGNSAVEIKVAEAQKACDDGAVEIDMVINIGKALGGNWDYVETEIAALCKAVHESNAILKVIFENDFLQDEHIIKLCEICSTVGADFVKTSTGYGFVKGDDGTYSYQGATHHDLKLMRQHAAPEVQVKAAGGVRTLDDLLAVQALGVTRVGATATVVMIEEAKKRFGGEQSVDAPVVDDTPGY